MSPGFFSIFNGQIRTVKEEKANQFKLAWNFKSKYNVEVRVGQSLTYKSWFTNL